MLVKIRILKRKTNLRTLYISSVIKKYCTYVHAQVSYKSDLSKQRLCSMQE